MPQPLASWNSARDVWEIPETEGLFCEHLDVFLETFPTSGTWADGMAYSLDGTTRPSRTSERHISDSACSSLLPTPSVADGMGGHLNRSGDRSNELLLPGVAKLLGSSQLHVAPIPTERGSTGTEG